MFKIILCSKITCQHNKNNKCNKKEIYLDKDGKCGVYKEVKCL